MSHTSVEQKSTMRWIPLEANPDIFQEWTGSLGLSPSEGTFCDIYGLDPDLLAFVPRPVYAVLMLFPITAAYEKARKERDEQSGPNGDEVKDVMYFKQTIGNACGTMGILHAMANTPVSLASDSPLAKIFSACRDLTPAQRANYLETCSEIEAAHSVAASTGQSQAPALDEDTDLHFSCFVKAKDASGSDVLVELDGRRRGPVNHGPLNGDLLEGAVEQVRKYMAISDSIQFNLIALTKPSEG